jgi:hypothetical protein
MKIYIDATLLNAKPENVANLTFARLVQGKANVIFQSKNADDFSKGNTFQWTQKYAIGAVETPVNEGVFVSMNCCSK